ncbi:MAG: hypothetical protein ACQEUO_18640 [Bacillota bacterium]
MRKYSNNKHLGKRKGRRTKKQGRINYEVLTCITQIMSVMLRLVLWFIDKYRNVS